MRIFAHLGDTGGNQIVMKFCIGVGVPDVITHANFGDDRFRGLGERGSNFILSIFLRCRQYTLWH